MAVHSTSTSKAHLQSQTYPSQFALKPHRPETGRTTRTSSNAIVNTKNYLAELIKRFTDPRKREPEFAYGFRPKIAPYEEILERYEKVD
jgi:hypothetical protein